MWIIISKLVKTTVKLQHQNSSNTACVQRLDTSITNQIIDFLRHHVWSFMEKHGHYQTTVWLSLQLTDFKIKINHSLVQNVLMQPQNNAAALSLCAKKQRTGLTQATSEPSHTWSERTS